MAAMFNPGRMKFGAFFAPMHPNTVNPTLALERDLDLIKWLDELSYDEAWVGEHHSGAYECISSPEVFLAVASAISPTGARTAGKYGLGMISVAASSPEGYKQLGNHWDICEAKAVEHGKTVSRSNWRVVTPFHVAETREQAFKDLEFGLMDMMRYFRKFGGSAFPIANNFDEAVNIWTTGGLGAFGVGVVGT